MTNEIKEILDNLKGNNNYFMIRGIPYRTKILLDYITNLQEENKYIKIELNVVRKDYKAYMKRTREYEDYLEQKRIYKS